MLFFGLYFCHVCKNVMTPMRANGNMLEFFCPRCGKKQINFSNRKNKDAMLYSKELQIGTFTLIKVPKNINQISPTFSIQPCPMSRSHAQSAFIIELYTF